MKNLAKQLSAIAILAFGLAVATPVSAQFGSPTGDRGPRNDSFSGSGYKDPQQKAADHLAKGLRLKDKANKETDAAKKAKLLEKALKEFESSNALHSNHDALLAIGLLRIEQGNRQGAMEACWQALGLKKASEGASACFEQAKAMPSNPQPATDMPAAGSGSN
ncbi:MAG TPA: hypothetical protein VE078_15010 [Thermoanaerobaculia bacterium]|nr:hypothetical protein [Thermoanaerobaculia bacterium]